MIHTVDGKSRLFGILGHPTGHSLSPRIHNAAFAGKKINAVYVPFDIAETGAQLKKAILTLNIQGLSVTIPHKAWAAKAADSCDDLTRCCGAANTLIRTEQNGAAALHAINTDGAGAVRALKTAVPNLRGRRFLLIGYGGSATAIAHSLLLDEQPAMIAVSGRNVRKRNSFVDGLRNQHARSATMLRSVNDSELNPGDVDIIIHTTPLGMQGYSAERELPLEADFIQDFHTVFDIVYTPASTPLLKAARSRGASIIQGYLMLLYQAVLQFEAFTGESAPENLMEKELLTALRSRT